MEGDKGVALAPVPSRVPRLRHNTPSLLVLLLVVVFVIVSRFWVLGDKPFHHDESLFASHAYHLSRTGDYDYDKVLHGPFLIDATALIFRIAGDSDATARLCVAICGVLLLFVVWRLRDCLGNLAAFLAVAFLAASPTLLFFSRFNRNDVPFALAAMTFLLCVIRFLQHGRLRHWFLALLAATWMICIKETYLIFLFTAATYVIGVALVERMADRPSSTGQVFVRFTDKRPRFRRAFALTTLQGLAVGLVIIVALFTTFFQHLEHVDGPFEAIRYWSGQHAEQRIFGEWHYHIPIIAMYEFLAVALVVWGVARALRRASWLRGKIAWGWLVWSVVLLAVLWPYRFPEEIKNVLHMTRGWHLWLAIQVFALIAAACTVLVTEGRRIEAFFLWWTLGSFLAYSYAGEKVPWVSVHIVLPMIVAAALFLQEIVQTASYKNTASDGEEGERPSPKSITLASAMRPLAEYARSSFPRTLVSAILLAAFVATVGVGLRLSFVNSADPAERHVYTHTTVDYKAMVEDVHDMAAATSDIPLERFPIFVAGHSIWPAVWYLRRWNLQRPKDPPEGGDVNDPSLLPPEAALRPAPLFVLDEYLDPQNNKEHALSRYPGLTRTHVIRRVPFREWWHQEELFVTFTRLFDIWIALVPKQYRVAPLTDADGRPVGWIGDRGGLPDMTIADAVEASRRAWRVIYDYLVYRHDFDPYRSPYPTRDHMAVLLFVRKDIYKKWTRLGGRHHPGRSRFVRRSPPTKTVLR